MISIERNALLLYSAEQIYTLINDVETYPQYMDGCVGAEVLEQTDGLMLARLDLAKKNIRYSLTTRNTLQPPERVTMQLVDGPLSDFSGEWRVQALHASACKVSIDIKFRLKSELLRGPLRMLLNAMADNMVDALTRRARDLYAAAK